jgi:hypothetical protein
VNTLGCWKGGVVHQSLLSDEPIIHLPVLHMDHNFKVFDRGSIGE